MTHIDLQAESLPEEPPTTAWSRWRTHIPVVAGVLVALVIGAVAWQLDRVALAVHKAQARNDIVRDLAAVRAAAETAINQRIHILSGLNAYISINPDITPTEFADLSAILMQQADGIRSITLIKDNVISDVYPRAGNEGAIGLELLQHPDQRAAAEHAIETGKPWLTGPVKLIQGGEAFIHRATVFITPADGQPGGGRYWGMTSLLIDKEILIAEILANVPAKVDVAVAEHSVYGTTARLIVGEKSTVNSDPIKAAISIPTGRWSLYGVPKGGWPKTDPRLAVRRVAGATAAVLLGLLIHYVLRTHLSYRDSLRRLQIANRQAQSGRELAERARQYAADESAAMQRYAAQLEEAQIASLNMMEDVEAARRELSASNLALGKSNQELEQFAYVASHDLQEPLRKVSSFCELLEEDYGDTFDDDGKQYLAYIIDGAHRMRGLIRDLLSYSRIESQGRDWEDVDVEQALKSALLNLQGSIDDGQAVITHDRMPTLRADERQFVQLLQNLIGNGIKYRGDDAPRIHVGVEADNAEWIFSVSDNGIGIDPRFHQAVFGIFRRLHGRGEYPGTGIGLAICKRIVERLHGRIWIESEAGKGTTFRFAIPKG